MSEDFWRRRLEAAKSAFSEAANGLGRANDAIEKTLAQFEDKTTGINFEELVQSLLDQGVNPKVIQTALQQAQGEIE